MEINECANVGAVTSAVAEGSNEVCLLYTSVSGRVAPGIAEAIRAGSMAITKRAMLSRAVSAIRHRTLIINLPGSPKAVEESLGFVLDTLPHALGLLRGTDGECGRS